jgi:predicted CoA-binding protein
MDKATLVLGASPKPERVSNMAVRALRKRGISVTAIGLRRSKVDDVPILAEWPGNLTGIHTVTLYMSAKHQHSYYDRIIKLLPKRIIFNPGTQNEELADMARETGIEVTEACMLVMLKNGSF